MRIAAVTDVRGGEFFGDLQHAIDAVRAFGTTPRVVFLEADDETLVRRFESSRRPHPLQGDGRLVDGINTERALLASLRESADLLIDTSTLNVHQLRTRIDSALGHDGTRQLQITVMSFGFKYGLPVDADFVGDCRFLPNPYWVPDLRPLTGEDAGVAAYVLDQPSAVPFLDAYETALRPGVLGVSAREQAVCNGRPGVHWRQTQKCGYGRRAGPSDHFRRSCRSGWFTVTSDVSSGRRAVEQGPAVVALGGGHGLAASLSALRRVTADLTAVVTVADDGGSSGRLRRDLGVLPPGDLRMALAALCEDDEWGRTWSQVVQHRFSGSRRPVRSQRRQLVDRGPVGTHR